VPALLVERARTEKRAGAKLSAATMETLQEVLDLIAEADVAVDAAQEVLSELMGVPNPDDETSSSSSSSSDAGGIAGEETDSGPGPDVVRELQAAKVVAARR
jgi:Glu-tRNA(Gln) amidotransferase subunit E-like FAD-binding protein